MSLEPVLATYDLQKSFGSFKAINGIDLQVYAGEAFGLLGPNGAGKTTLIGMILGLLHPNSGTITLFGEPIDGAAPYLSHRIGAMLERPAFYPHLSGWDNLRVFAKALGGVPEPKIVELLKFVGLNSRAQLKFSTYSSGLKQRLSLACALLTDPDLILLDEPTMGLDPSGIREVRDLIGELTAQGKTVFLASHILHEVEQICQRVAVINRGNLLAQGFINELVRQDNALRLQIADLTAGANHLASLADIGKVEIKEDHLLLEASMDQADKIREHLANVGIYPSRIEPQKSNLEDFFIDLMKTSTKE